MPASACSCSLVDVCILFSETPACACQSPALLCVLTTGQGALSNVPAREILMADGAERQVCAVCLARCSLQGKVAFGEKHAWELERACSTAFQALPDVAKSTS